MRFTIHKVLAILLACLGIFGCNQIKKNYLVKVKLVKLTAANIFDKELVSDYLFDSEEMQVDSLKNKSRRIFLQGVDLYKNKKDPEGAIDLFKQSVIIFPDAKTYYELGNAILDRYGNASALERKMRLKDALSAYQVADYLHFQPQSSLYYNEACANNLIYASDTTQTSEGFSRDAFDDIELAFRNGFTDTVSLRGDKRICSILKTPVYKNFITDLVTKRAMGHVETFFDAYEKSFPTVSQSFKIDTNKVAMEDYKQSISYDFVKFIPEMENVQFGRMVSNDFFYVAKVAETTNYIALIYCSKEFEEGDMQPVHVNLVTYDHSGNILSSRLFAGQFTPEKIRAGKIDGNKIVLEDYKRTWKYKMDSVSYWDNKIIKYEFAQTATFMINDSGKIVKQSVPENFNDSSSIVSTKLSR
jgi:hypothetical protein